MSCKTKTLAGVIALALLSGPATADHSKACSVKKLAGNWLFATSIGRQMLGAPFPPDQDITAIGTMNIERDGTMSGKFDVTVEGFGFLSNVLYSGVVTVNPDCTGSISFSTSQGSARTDSIVVLSRKEILAMSQDPMNLWTYQVRRIAGRLDNDRD